jgi:anti-sigma regulatory factor (Ser/Thr protein kinase)
MSTPAESQMKSDGTAMRHSALVYESQDEYVTRAVAFLREGLEAGEGAVVGNTRPGLAAVREALGSDAARVRFIDVGTAYTRPAWTFAAYHQVYAEEFRKASSVRVISDVQFGPEPGEWDLWMGYEALMNHAFAHLPTWAMCTYNANWLPDRLLEAVWRTHPEVVADNASTQSEHFEDPTELLRRITPAPEPLPELRSISSGGDAEYLREQLAGELAAAGVAQAKILDMLLAVSELAANAAQHGGGVKDVRVGRAGGRFVCEIVDRGSGFDDPTAGYLPPRDGLGSGLWVARQLVWRIEFFHSPLGFTARIWL